MVFIYIWKSKCCSLITS